MLRRTDSAMLGTGAYEQQASIVCEEQEHNGCEEQEHSGCEEQAPTMYEK